MVRVTVLKFSGAFPTFMYEKNMVKLLLQGSTGLRTLESVLLSVAVICIPITVAKKTMWFHRVWDFGLLCGMLWIQAHGPCWFFFSFPDTAEITLSTYRFHNNGLTIEVAKVLCSTSAVIANMFMEDIEQRALASSPVKPFFPETICRWCYFSGMPLFAFEFSSAVYPAHPWAWKG